MNNIVENTQYKETSLFNKVINYKIGIVPLPLYIIFVAIVYLCAITEKLPADLIGGFATILVIGTLLGHLGLKLPIIKNIGGPAILAIFVPSAMVYYNILSPSAVKSITTLIKTSNFLYFYIACLVVGSIFGMNRKVLIKGFAKLIIPMLCAMIAASGVGLLVGMLLGKSPFDTFFYNIVPIMAGGLGEGILPLSMGYSDILHQSKDVFYSRLIPAAMIGNITAIISAGFFKYLGEKKPKLSGNGVLTKSGDDDDIKNAKNEEEPINFQLMGLGVFLACCIYLAGTLIGGVIGIPGPIVMIFGAAIAKYFKVVPRRIEVGAHHFYKFLTGTFTWPLLSGLGVTLVPFGDLTNSVTPSFVIIVVACVLTIVSVGFFSGKFMNMYPVESGIVIACQSGLGGTGDVAILSTSNRMELMPFAQIATRLGGASMVIIATLLMKMFA